MMKILSSILVSIVGMLHVGFMLLEMYFWNKPLGMKIFRMSIEDAQRTHVLAMNQGLYNGILAAGLFWSVWEQDFKKTLFFLGCVIVAGVFGALTATRSIFFIQAMPAIIALIVLILNHYS